MDVCVVPNPSITASPKKEKRHRRKKPSTDRPSGASNADKLHAANAEVSLSQEAASNSLTSTELTTTSATSATYRSLDEESNSTNQMKGGVSSHGHYIGNANVSHDNQYSTVFNNRYLEACRDMNVVPSEAVLAAGQHMLYRVRDICIAHGGSHSGGTGDEVCPFDRRDMGLHSDMNYSIPGEKYSAMPTKLNNGNDEYDMRHLAQYINSRSHNSNTVDGTTNAQSSAPTGPSHMKGIATNHSPEEDIILCFVLSNVTLGNRGALALGTALQGIPFTIISMCECFLQDSGCKSITDAIISDGTLCSSLVELDLRGNAIRDGRPIATVLVACQFLKSLRLGWNKIGLCSSSTSVLLAAARTHRSLSMLDMSNCVMGGDALLPIAQLIIAQSKALTHLDISWNSLGTGGGGAAIHGAVIKNNILRSLNVIGNGFAQREMEGIEAKLGVNGRIFLDFETRERQSCTLAAKVKDLEAKVESLSVTCDILRSTNKQLLEEKESLMMTSSTVKGELSNKIAEMEHHVVESEQRARTVILQADDRVAEQRRIADEAVSQSRQREIELNEMMKKTLATENANIKTVADLKREIESLKEQICSLTGSLKQCSSDYSAAINEITEKRQEFVKLQTDLLLAQEEKSRRVSEVSTRCGEIKVLEERVRELQSDNASLQGHVRQLNESAAQWKLEKEEIVTTCAKEQQAMREDCNRRVERVIEEYTHSTKLLKNTLDSTKQALSDRNDDANRERERLLEDIHNLSVLESEKQTLMLELQAAKQEKRKAETNEHMGAQRLKVMHDELQKMQMEQQEKVKVIESQYEDEIIRLQEQLLSKATDLQEMENELIKVKSQLRSIEQNKQKDSEALEKKLIVTLRNALHSS